VNRIRWTPLSLEDLQDISLYIESQRDIATANRVCRSIYEAVQKLRQFPESGKPGLEAGTRELVVAKFPAYIVVYRLSLAVEILRIWHGAQERIG
jgi:toxin ParE1/3/4